jgi:predicted XRE-type DNA-binding protein
MRRRISRKAVVGKGNARNEGQASVPARAVAVKRVLASQIEQAMNDNKLTKAEMARRMETSRSQLNRLLDPDRESVTLDTLARAARAIGRRVRVELVE